MCQIKSWVLNLNSNTFVITAPALVGNYFDEEDEDDDSDDEDDEDVDLEELLKAAGIFIEFLIFQSKMFYSTSMYML